MVKRLEHPGVDVFAESTPQPTCLRLEYPSANVHERAIHVTSTAGAFTLEQTTLLQARAFVVGASLRDEVPISVIKPLASRGTRLAVDVEAFVRVDHGSTLVYEA